MDFVVSRKAEMKNGDGIWVDCPWHCQNVGVAENCLGCPLFVTLVTVDKTNLKLTCAWNGWDDLKKTVDDYGDLTNWG